MKSLIDADAGTYSGVDKDDALDMDDEIVFMARFLGEKHNNLNNPEGVLEGIMEELEEIDPVSDSSLGYMYLFLSDGSLDQSDYFDVYNFGASLPSLTDYNISNKEDSYFQSQHYRRHFVENWNSENVDIFAGDSTAEGLMARQKFQFGKDTCGRCVFTFKHGVVQASLSTRLVQSVP